MLDSLTWMLALVVALAGLKKLKLTASKLNKVSGL
jgi:hypothetical protein